MEQRVEKEQYLRHLYFDPETGYMGLKKLWDKVKEKKTSFRFKYKEVKDFLDDLATYQLHKPVRRKFNYRKTMVSYVDQQWQADLVDMQKYEKENKGYRFILTVIDIFSRYGWALPLKSKRGKEVKDLFVDIFKEAKPQKVQFDEGKEFYNKDLKELLSEKGVEWFSSYSDKKAAVVERFNRTLKSRMWKYFTEKETLVWYDVLDKFVKGYNNSYHSSVGMTPNDARDEDNSSVVWYNLYGPHLEKTYGKPKFEAGQSVRIQKFKTIFTKGYLPNYSEEIFKIKEVIFTHPIVYKLEDLTDEEIDGYFYEEELSFVPNPDEIEYKIEKIIRYKTEKGKKYALVKWKGYGEKFNSWEPASNIKSIL